MERTKPNAVFEAHSFFAEELRTVMEKHQLSAQGEAFNYLVHLLVRSIESDKFFVKRPDGKLDNNFLVEIYNESLGADLNVKKAALQRLGDICLVISGFFAESLQRKLVDVGYYFGMGGTAYKQLSTLQLNASMRSCYGELSDKFQPFSNVLNEMSERSGIQSNKDLLRLYERWLTTGSDRLKSVLNEHGIATPVVIDPKTKH